MKYVMLFYVVLQSICVAACNNTPTITPYWTSSNDLRVPESVMYDAGRQLCYITNINGKPTEKNKKGFIAKVSLKGEIKQLQWIKGLNAPKGMGLIKNTLYVTDIDRLHKIDCRKGRIVKTYYIKGAKFLNDIAIDAKGNVYISDMHTHKVHLLSNNRVTTWLNLKAYKNPNGLYLHDTMLYIGTSIGLLKAEITTKKILMAYPLEGGIDGIKAYNKDSFIVTDWKGTTRLLRIEKEPLVLLDTSHNNIQAADFEYIPEREMLIIPTFFDNRVMAYLLK